ncbi:MAG TPA: lipid A deacylase LpxR family protein [Opitutales bacterium]|nr:lipid A deacylase LpxR family protein [Opitutales bacterium]
MYIYLIITLTRLIKPVFFLVSALIIISFCNALAQLPEEAEQPTYLLLQMDNDATAESDRNYTNGLRIGWMHPVKDQKLNRYQDWLRPFTEVQLPFGRRLHRDSAEIDYDFGMGITQLMFTPDDDEAVVAPPGERPYAGWLGMEVSLHAKDTRALSSVILTIGATGEPSLAEQAQDFVHKHITRTNLFQGWDTQVPFELTVNLNFDRKLRLRKLTEATADLFLDVEGHIEYGASVGNYRTDAYVGGLVRFGYNLPIAYMHPRVEVGSYAHQLFTGMNNTKNRWSWSGFLGTRGTAVAHDITLDGPWFRSHDGVDSEPWVGELLMGIGIRYKNVTLTYSRTFRTREFKGQNKRHDFGSLQVSVAY